MIFTLIVFILFGGLAAAAFVVAFNAGTVRNGMISGVVGLGLAIVALLSLGLVNIEPGRVGVVTVFGAVQENELPPGIHWRVPVVNSIIVVDTRVQAVRIEGYTAASREQQDLFLTLTLNYHVQPTEASTIVQTIGLDFNQKIIQPRLQNIPKTVTDDYATTVVLNEREEIRQRAQELLEAELEPFGIVVDSLLLENFSYSEEYNAAIEQKQIEQQRVQTEQQILEQRRIQAEQAVIKAQGEADAAIETARGQAEANRLLAESISAQLIQWQAIQKLNPNVQIMLVPSDNGFIIDLKQLQEATQR